MGEGRRGLRLHALGGLAIEFGGERVEHAIPAKSAALVAYLTDVGGRVTRGRLAGLLWSEHDDAAARRNLRVALTRARSVLGNVIQADRAAVWLDGDVRYDVRELETATLDDLPVGEFLSGFEVPGADVFDDWMHARRATVRELVLDHLVDGAATANRRGRWADGARLADRALEVEPWREDAHRLALRATAHTAGRAAALARHQAFASALQDHVGVAPERRTVTLVEELRGQVDDEPAGSDVASCAETPLPSWPTDFVGRSDELSALAAAARPGRVVVIVGQGGIGKSRLLREFAHRRRLDGRRVVHVSLQSVGACAGEASIRAFAEPVVAALGERVGRDEDALDTLLRTLRTVAGSETVTLCVDNVEQLADVERAVAPINASCPHVELVLTSRRRLDLLSVSEIVLTGLAATTDGDVVPAAVQLLAERSALDVADEHVAASMGRICEALGGHPLAIELAARWASSIPLDDLAALAGSAPMLATDAADVPERHRSLDVLVGASVDRVSDAARNVLTAASVFAGPFTTADLSAVVDVTSRLLAELSDHSLLGIDGPMFRLHPIVRTVAAEWLDASGRTADTARAHARRMIGVLGQLNQPGIDPSVFPRRADDLRAAVRWTIAFGDAHDALAAVGDYVGHLATWGWTDEAFAIIDRLAERGDLSPAQRGEVHRHRADLLLNVGRPDAAVPELERGLHLVGAPFPTGTVARTLKTAGLVAALPFARLRALSSGSADRAAERARLMSSLGELYYVSDRRAEMISYGVGALSAGRVSRQPELLAAGDAALAIAWQLRGSVTNAERYRGRARRRLTDLDASDYTAVETWGILALVAASGGRFDEARDDCAVAGEVASRSGRIRMGTQIDILHALVDHHAGRSGAALARLARVEAALERAGFGRGLTWVHATRAEVALSTGDLALAREAASHARRLADDQGVPVDAARALVALARVALCEHDAAGAHDLLAEAAPALRTDAALAFQFSDAHRGRAEAALATAIARGDGVVDVAEPVMRLRRVAKALPLLADDAERLHRRRLDHGGRHGRMRSGDQPQVPAAASVQVS